jgi:hypothetical protein
MTKFDLALSRRHVLMGASAAGALGTFGSLGSALAKALMLNTQAPYFYRFKDRDFEATVASDGQLPLGDPHKNYLGLGDTAVDKQLTDNFLPLGNTVLEQNDECGERHRPVTLPKVRTYAELKAAGVLK